MTSHTQSLSGPTGDEPPADLSLNYSSSCVVYLFLGQKATGQPTEQYDAWVRMTRADLENANTFKQALTRYIESSIDFGMTHYYPYFGDVMIFPISFPPPGEHRRRFILRTEPHDNGQMYSLLPEDCRPGFPSVIDVEDLTEGNPFESRCRQVEDPELEDYDISAQIWLERLQRIKDLVEMAEREELPPELSSSTRAVTMDDNIVGNTGRGAWSATKLGRLLTKEYLEEASREYESARSGVTMNGWH